MRGVSCLSCHANIQANVISDFGNGNPYFMTQDYYQAEALQGLSEISGNLVVPATTVAPSISGNSHYSSIGVTSSTSLLQFLENSEIPEANPAYDFSYWGLTPPATLAPNAKVQDKTEEGPYVYIGAPTAEEIRDLAPNPSEAAPWVQVVSATSSSTLSELGLVAMSGYYMNDPTSASVNCAGMDVVIDGTLLLNSATVNAGKGGCRLYVTGSVFIQGPIDYLNDGSDPTQNLQITSAESVLMGIGNDGTSYEGGKNNRMNSYGTSNAQPILNSSGQSYTSLQVRVLAKGDGRPPVMRGDFTAWSTAVYAEGLNMGGMLHDASVGANSSSPKSASGQPRLSYTYKNLLLNAPVVQSRYLGLMQGVIVSEVAQFSLGEFSFAYDPVFTRPDVSILPALKNYDILCVGASNIPCSPAQQ